ncbi:MAG: hypothetical protein FWD57_01565, partial [Polyangiaceae bacterium]|nr:hypothetical protein [Polyangiaceae bacterium]
MNSRQHHLIILAIVAATLTPIGCKGISQFATADGESFCGQIIPGGFIRQGFAPGVRMRVHIDPDNIQEAPGVISTDDGSFENASMRPIPQVAHDSL